MIDLYEQIEQKLNSIQYISHWVSLTSLLKKCNKKKPFLNLRRFSQQNFTRKHQMTINHLYFQRIFLASIAIQKNLNLQISQNFYEKDGLVFGVYEFYTQDNTTKDLRGIKMQQQVNCQFCDGILEYVKQKTGKLLNDYVIPLKFNPKDEYQEWTAGINTMNMTNKDIQPQQFINQIQKWPLTQHYVFNVKLKNALLLPSFLQKAQHVENFRKFRKQQAALVEQLSSQTADVNAIFKKLESGIGQIFGILTKPNKIIQFVSTSPQQNQKSSKSKQLVKQLRKQINFKITLSQSRGKAIINEQKMQNNEQSVKKIQIKPNGQIAPVSGNVIHVTIFWEMSVQARSFRLKLQCYNNRKVQQLYYDEFSQFWNQLNNSEQFKQIVGVDKYTTTLADKQKLQVVLSNYCPGCLLSQAFIQIDKILALAISLDEVVQICERKGLQIEDPNSFQIQPYMKIHAKQKFKRALKQIVKNSNKLYKSNNSQYQNQFNQ